MREIAGVIFAAFIFPGDFVLSQISSYVPAAAAIFAAIDDWTRLVAEILVALLVWACLAVAMRLAFRLLRDVAWIVSTRFRILLFRCSVGMDKIKFFVEHRIRTLFPRRTPLDNRASHVDFDDIDLAVLLSAAARGPGSATSAPELADQLKWRPGEIQCSIDKLKSNKMLDYAFGSTDGYDTYCLSQLGTSFVGMLRSRRRASV